MSTRAGDALTATCRRGEQVLQHICQLKGGWHMAWLGCPVASRAQSGAVWTVDAAARARYASGPACRTARTPRRRADSACPAVRRYTQAWGEGGTDDGQLNYPQGICVDGEGGV